LKSESQEGSSDNPFNPGKPAEKEFFVGRKDELNQIVRYLKQAVSGSSFNILLFGEKGIGKTSLLNKVIEKASEENLLAVGIRCDKTMDAFKFFENLERRIIDEGLKRNELKFKFWQKEFNKTPDKQEYFRLRQEAESKEIVTDDLIADFKLLLKEVKEIAKGILVVIDEGQFLETIDGDILVKLKGILQTIGEGYMVIISSTGNVVDKLAEKHQSSGVERLFGDIIELLVLKDNEEVQDLINKRVKDLPMKFEDNVVNQIALVSGRHPREIVKICQNVYGKATDKGITLIDSSLLRESIYHLYREKIDTIRETYANLLPTEQGTLRTLLELGGKASVDLMLQNVPSHLREHMKTTYIEELEHLCEKGLIARTKFVETVTFSIIDPLIEYTLKAEMQIS